MSLSVATFQESCLKDFSQHLALKTLRVMYLSRYMDEKMAILVKQNKGGTFHMNGLGHELVGAVSALHLKPGYDYAFPYYRDKSFALGFGCCPIELFGTFMGRATEHHSKGRMMPEHFSHQQLHIPVQSSVVASQFLQACGLALGLKLQNKDQLVYVSGGDGSTSEGDFHEALNFASLHQLGVIFVIQDNGWAISVPISEQTAGGSIVNMAKGYAGLAVAEVDGVDFVSMSDVMAQAVERGRRRAGPTLIVAKVPRLGPHSSSDDPKKYQSQEQIDQAALKDPCVLMERYLCDVCHIDSASIETLKKQIQSQIHTSAAQADALPFPDPASAKDHVFKAFEKKVTHRKDDRPLQESIVMVDSLNHALKEAMQKDPSIIVFGQDVARGKGGVFGVTRQLTELFGENRCFNTPLAESTIIGAAIGLCFDGYHQPVVEIQFADYLWTGINQLFNELASIHYRSCGEWHCPMVVRMPTGGYIQGGPYHSQSIEGFLAHCPGLKIVMPSHAKDAKLLMKAAIEDPNPVIFLEHKALYRQRKFCSREEPYSDEEDQLGKAAVVRSGKDLTMITWGMTTVMGYELTEKLYKEHNIDLELIDLRTLVPYDKACLEASIKKTGKVVIAHEAPKQCGFGAEIAAWIAEDLFEYLDAPVKRLGSFESAVPYSKVLEDAVLLQKKTIEQACLELARF